MLQKLIPNYELFLRVVGDADPYEFHRKNAFSVGNAVLSVPLNTGKFSQFTNSALKNAEVLEQDFKTHQNKNKSARKLCL